MKNLIPVLITPFDEVGEIYVQGLEILYSYLKTLGVEKVFAGGSYAAFALLTREQRIQLGVESDRVAKKNGIQTIFNVGSSSPEETKILIQALEQQANIEAFAVVAPYYYSNNGTYDFSRIEAYLNWVCEQSTTPVYFYNNPKTTGLDLTAAQLNALTETTDIAGIKDSNESMNKLMEISELSIGDPKADVRYIPGTTASMLVAGNLNIRECMSGIFMSFPELIGGLFEAAQSGDSAKAMALYKTSMKVRDLMGKYAPRAVSAYYVLKRRGIDLGLPKFPWPRLTSEQEEDLLRSLVDLGVLKAG